MLVVRLPLSEAFLAYLLIGCVHATGRTGPQTLALATVDDVGVSHEEFSRCGELFLAVYGRSRSVQRLVEILGPLLGLIIDRIHDFCSSQTCHLNYYLYNLKLFSNHIDEDPNAFHDSSHFCARI